MVQLKELSQVEKRRLFADAQASMMSGVYLVMASGRLVDGLRKVCAQVITYNIFYIVSRESC